MQTFFTKHGGHLAFAVAALLIASLVLPGMFQSFAAHAAISGNDDPVTQYATSSNVWVGKDVTTNPIASFSPGRSYLEITNISGATGTPTAMYCNVGRTAALAAPTLYKGIVIQASSTRIWGRQDSVPIGFIRCIGATASGTVSIIEK